MTPGWRDSTGWLVALLAHLEGTMAGGTWRLQDWLVRGDDDVGGDGPPLVVTLTVCDGEALLLVIGEADRFSAPLLVARIEEALDLGARRLVVDLGGAAFVDSSILLRLAIVGRGLHADSGAVAVVGASPVVQRMCEVLALGDALTITGR